MGQNDLDYHRHRASHELHLGLIANSVPVARAHLKLSSLHFARLRELEGNRPRTERPLFVM